MQSISKKPVGGDMSRDEQVGDDTAFSPCIAPIDDDRGRPLVFVTILHDFHFPMPTECR